MCGFYYYSTFIFVYDEVRQRVCTNKFHFLNAQNQQNHEIHTKMRHNNCAVVALDQTIERTGEHIYKAPTKYPAAASVASHQFTESH